MAQLGTDRFDPNTSFKQDGGEQPAPLLSEVVRDLSGPPLTTVTEVAQATPPNTLPNGTRLGGGNDSGRRGLIDPNQAPWRAFVTPPPAGSQPPRSLSQPPRTPLPKSERDAQAGGTGIDVTNPNPGATPPKYPGPPHDQDKWIIEKMLRPSPLASALYQLYLETYTDRSGENKVPGAVKIAELHKGIKEKVKTIELLGDSEMFQPDGHGIVLHPTGMKQPNSFYAVLRDERGIPINIIQYTQVSGKPKYLQQWIFDREKTADGQKTTVSHFRESSQTAIGRPGAQNATMVDALIGRTEYVTDAQGEMTRATQFNNLNQKTIDVDLSSGSPQLELRDPNSGLMRKTSFSRAYLTRMPFSSIYVR